MPPVTLLKDKMPNFREKPRKEFQIATLERWAAYEESGLHVTAAEADAWLARLEAGETAPMP